MGDNDMSKLRQHIEEMRARLDEVAHDEEALVKALGDALNRLDEALLRDVRTIASEHEARREQILGELQGLASGIGMFHPPLAPPAEQEELPSYMPHEHQVTHHHNGHTASVAPGDWRQATSNIDEEPVFELEGLEGLGQRH